MNDLKFSTDNLDFDIGNLQNCFKKYILTDDTIEWEGHTLRQIKSVKNFGCVSKEMRGGFVEGEWNLSQHGNCWIFPTAKVYDYASVEGNAIVKGEAQIYGRARIKGFAVVSDFAKVFQYATVTDNARVTDSAQIYGSSLICDYAKILDHAKIYGFSNISGNALIYNNAEINGGHNISGNSKICTDGYISSDKDYLVIGPIGSRYDYTTFYKTKSGGIFVKCGCFSGSLHNFKQAVQKKYGITSLYLPAIELAEAKMVQKGVKDGD